MGEFLAGLFTTEFFIGLGIGLFILVMYAILVSGGKADLARENARLRKGLKALREIGTQASATIKALQGRMK